MKNLLAAIYSIVIYVLFLGVFVYAIGFVEGVGVPKNLDTGPGGDVLWTLLIDTGLLTLFALQHSVMARPVFKRVWTRIIPAEIERSTFVLCASAALAFLCWQWRPLPQPVWVVDAPVAAWALRAVSWSGWAMLLISTFLISHFQLFGLTQGTAQLRGRNVPVLAFVTPLFYRYLRHPLYLGFLLAFWATPRMTFGHLFFAIATTGYIFVGIWFEERDLIAHFGDRYRQYKASVGMLIPKLRLGAPRKQAAR
jgi:protein-S-isoprenylcysteine O-methyltransferase Ste14